MRYGLKIILLMLFGITISQAKVYQTVDEDGRVIFTDQPSKDSIERELQSPTVITIKKNQPKTEKKPETRDSAVKIKEEKPLKYKSVAITFPQNDQAVRDNLGNVTIELEIDPGLQTKFGHVVKTELDGKLLSMESTSNSVNLSNIDRGTHSLAVHIYDEKGLRLISSSSISFHMLRFSRLFKK